MANQYHSLKLFRLLIGDVSQVKFADLIGFDSSAVSLVESGARSGRRLCPAIQALLHPLATAEDVEALVGGAMGITDVHRLAEAYARVKAFKPANDGSPGGLNHGTESTDAGGTAEVRAATEPAGDRATSGNGPGASEQGGTRASA